MGEDITRVVALSILLATATYVIGSWTRTTLPALVGYVAHWTAAIGASLIAGLIVPDARLYHLLASGQASAETFELPFGKEGWTHLLGFLYGVFGNVPQIGLVANVFASAMTVVAIMLIARVLRLPELRSGWFAALLPPIVLWSSLLLRESFTWLFLCLATLGFAGLALTRRVVLSGILAATSLVALFDFRATAAILMLVAGAIAVPIVRRNYGLLVVSVALTGAFTFSRFGAPVREIIEQYDVVRILDSRQWLSDNATTGFPVDSLPQVALRVLLGPAPWEWGTVGVVFAADGVLWVAACVLAVRGTLSMPDRRVSLILWAPVAIFLISLILNSGNYGTMQRLRVQPELFLLPLAAAGSFWRRPAPFASEWTTPRSQRLVRRSKRRRHRTLA